MKHSYLIIFFLFLCINVDAQKEENVFSELSSLPTHDIKDIKIRDPFVYADNETKTYYLYSATNLESENINDHGIKAYYSKDLKTWFGPKILYRVGKDSWADKSHGVWAPEMHKYNNKYYLFATFTNENTLLTQKEGRPKIFTRAVEILESDSPLGPFRPIKKDAPQTPKNWMSLDGTLWKENNQPYLIFCHEWIQTENGTIEVAKMSKDLSRMISKPTTLFKALDAQWVVSIKKYKDMKPKGYITDGCFLHRLKSGKLLMLWSSFSKSGYAVSTAISQTGLIMGPWIQREEPLFKENGGHAMLFTTFDGKLLMPLHYPNNETTPRCRFFEVIETEDDIEIVNEFIP